MPLGSALLPVTAKTNILNVQYANQFLERLLVKLSLRFRDLNLSLQRGMVFFCYHIYPPSFLPGGRFYGVFFPSGFLAGKKKPPAKFDLDPKTWKNPHPVGNKSRLFTPRFFFFVPNPEGKKKTVK